MTTPRHPGRTTLRLLVGLLVLLAAGASSAAEPQRPAPLPILDPDKEGLELATRLQTAAPERNDEFHGVLEITPRPGAATVRIPIRSRLNLTSTNWQVVYETSPPPGRENEKEILTILHSPNGPNSYLFVQGTNVDATGLLTAPFAGSDFWLQDLGLEFFHWPKQRAIRAEMSRGQPCRVLESVQSHPPAGGYSRVVSWIDLETGGVLQAEAYDAGNSRPMKKFSLGSFERVKGQMHLRDMKIRNLRTGSQTELKIELHQKE